MNQIRMQQEIIETFNQYCKNVICINLNDIKSVLQQNEHPLLIRIHDDVTNITPRLQAEMTKVNPDKASKAVLRIGYSADVEVQFEQVQSILRIINDAIPNVNLVWGYGIDDKLPDGHCSILLLIG